MKLLPSRASLCFRLHLQRYKINIKYILKCTLQFDLLKQSTIFSPCNLTYTPKNEGREAQELSGAGATFPLPFYNVVFEKFSELNGDVVAYGGIGSGGGVRNLRDKIVDFAGSDAFLSDKEMSEMAEVVHVPTCMGAVVLAYNLEGVEDLRLSGEVIAQIFAGDITMWNDERLVALNPGVTLPAEMIRRTCS